MRLIVVRGPSPAGPFDLREGVQHAGRGPECEVFLPSKRVSRKHAVFTVVGGRVEVRDLESHNGILAADGTRVASLQLASGERVQVGDYVLRLEIPADDLLLEEDDDVLLDEETAEAEAPEPAPRPVAPPPAAPPASPGPPPAFAFGPAQGGGFGGPPPPAAPPRLAPAEAQRSRSPGPGAAASRPAEPARPASPPPPAAVPPPPTLPFSTSAGFGGRPGRGLPPDPSRSIIAEPEDTRSDAPPPWVPDKPRAEAAARPASPPPAAPPPPSPPRAASGPTLAPLPFGPPAGGFTAAAPAAAPPAPPPPFPTPPPRAAAAPAAPAPAAAPPPALAKPSAPRPAPRPAEPAPARLDALPVDAAPAARATGLSWLVQAVLLLVAVLALMSCTNLVHGLYGGSNIRAVSELRGVALAEALANRNAQPLADQRGIALDTAFLLERPGVTKASIVDPRGTVLAPAERLRTSVGNSKAFAGASSTGAPTVEEAGDGEGALEIAFPIRAQIGGTGPRQIVGYALIGYDPDAVIESGGWVSGGFSVFATLAVGALLLGGAWWLMLRPLAALREETELALLGDTHDVASPIRLAQMEQLAHSINRVVARARAAGGARPR